MKDYYPFKVYDLSTLRGWIAYKIDKWREKRKYTPAEIGSEVEQGLEIE